MPAVYEKVTPGPSADKDHNELGCILDEGMALQIDSAWAACEAAIAAHVPVMRAHIAKNLPLIMATRRDVRCGGGQRAVLWAGRGSRNGGCSRTSLVA